MSPGSPFPPVSLCANHAWCGLLSHSPEPCAPAAQHWGSVAIDGEGSPLACLWHSYILAITHKSHTKVRGVQLRCTTRLVRSAGATLAADGPRRAVDAGHGGPDRRLRNVRMLTTAQLTSPTASTWPYLPYLVPWWPWDSPQVKRVHHAPHGSGPRRPPDGRPTE